MNQNFPEGDGVQIFLTFDLSFVQETITEARLQAPKENIHFSGTHLEDWGNLIVEEVRYDTFSSKLWDLGSSGNGCIFATSEEGPFECDVSSIVTNSLNDNYRYAQSRIRFENPGDNDGQQDMVMFYITNSNTNERGIFELVIE